MSLTLETGKKLLRQIVGGYGSFSGGNLTPYLALSSTKPYHEPSETGSYNVTEPSTATTSYKRVALGVGYFGADATGKTDPETGKYVITIANDQEIHFPEALQDWGSFSYFAIFADKNGTAPIYVGELDSYTEVEVTAETFDELVRSGLYIKTDTETGIIYVKVEAGDTFDPEAIYAEKKLTVKGGTVPLVRSGYLKISVE